MSLKKEAEDLGIGLAALAVLGGGFFIAYWVWPSGITDMPLAQLTLGMIGSAFGSVVIVCVAIGIVMSFYD